MSVENRGLSLQERIDVMVAQGKRPVIELTPGMQIVMPKRRVGRPRVRDSQTPYRHYADLRAGKQRPRCLARGCNRCLGVRQRGVCSESCGDTIFNRALFLLRSVGATRAEILEFFPDAGPTPAPPSPTPKPQPSQKRLRAARRAIA